MTAAGCTIEGTRFPGIRSPVGEAERWTWESLVEACRRPLDLPAEGKGALPAWSPARFRGNYRRGDCVERVSALVLDLDSDPEAPLPKRGEPDLNPARLRAVLSAALEGVAWAAHTTPSSRPDRWRWRGIVSLSDPVDSDTVHGPRTRLVRACPESRRARRLPRDRFTG